ncbi:hypothetical protein Tco_0105180, partial [Tanacetum coccineum]
MVVEGIANMALTMWGWGLLVVMVLDAMEQEMRCEGDRKSLWWLEFGKLAEIVPHGYIEYYNEGNQSNGNAGTKACDNVGKARMETGKIVSDGKSTNNVNAVSSTVISAVTKVNVVDPKTSIELLNDLNMPELEDIVYSNDDEDVGAEADMNNLDAFTPVSPIPTTRIHKDHPVDQIIGDLNSMDVKSAFLFDDIIFGSTKKKLCTEFEKMTHKKFQMSSMGELIFFLGVQVKQKEDGIFMPRQMVKIFQVNPKVSHLHNVKRIFRYLKGQPKLGLWYPKDSPFDLVAYTDSEYVGASLDRKSTTRVKNPVFNSTTKYIEIRHHFIKDSNEKKLIQMIKIHTDKNVVDLLTKAFDEGIGVN